MPTLIMNHVSKSYTWEGRKLFAVNDVSLKIDQGEFVFITGSGGSGKSTLLRLMTGDLSPDSGSISLGGTEYSKINPARRYMLKRNFGYVRQEPFLMRKRSIEENLILAINGAGIRRGDLPRQHLEKVLGLVGLSGVEHKYPGELSGGECRKLELARALVASPHILVLDELTANWDPDSTWDIMYLLNELNREGTTVIMATHASTFVTIMRRRVITLVDGKILGDVPKGRYGDIL